MDMVGVMARLPRTISLMARGGTPMARAMAFWEIFMGVRYSSSKISPGVMGGLMGCNVSRYRASRLVVLLGGQARGRGEQGGDVPRRWPAGCRPVRAGSPRSPRQASF